MLTVKEMQAAESFKRAVRKAGGAIRDEDLDRRDCFGSYEPSVSSGSKPKVPDKSTKVDSEE